MKPVVAALAGNIHIAVVKGIVSSVTGSTAMLVETLHGNKNIINLC